MLMFHDLRAFYALSYTMNAIRSWRYKKSLRSYPTYSFDELKCTLCEHPANYRLACITQEGVLLEIELFGYEVLWPDQIRVQTKEFLMDGRQAKSTRISPGFWIYRDTADEFYLVG